jgi:alpha-beta hydrolase superfamily lysophospholipase
MKKMSKKTIVIGIFFSICLIYFIYSVMNKKKNEELEKKRVQDVLKRREENDKSKRVINKTEYFKYLSTYKVFEHEYPDGNKTTLTYKKKKGNKKALLWVHGFNDYYFHFKIGDALVNEFDTDIYAITLRRYGSTIKKDDNLLFYTDDLEEYIEDINICFNQILNNDYEKIIMYGHSTGGLTSTIYCDRGMYKNKIDALILNSPFFDLNDSGIMEWVLKNIIYYIGVINPKFQLSGMDDTQWNATSEETFERFYFNPVYKLRGNSPIYAGWIKTVHYYQNQIHNGDININIPILVLYSDKTLKYPEQDKGDNVLDVNEINKYSDLLGKNVTEYIVKDATHDVFCSESKPRNNAMSKMLKFLKSIN